MDIKKLADFSTELCAEGTVLLKNDGNMLPVRDEKISVFGRTQINYLKSGTGSGGAVNVRNSINILDGLRDNEHIILNEELAADYERLVKEHPADYSNTFESDFTDKEFVPDDAIIEKASEFSDKAIVIIGRVSGESYDNVPREGSFCLTPNERELLKKVTGLFKQTAVLINCGNTVNIKEILGYGIDALMLIWQGGQYGGKAVAQLLSGDSYPSGKLADTIANAYTDYPCGETFGQSRPQVYGEDIYVGYRYFETFAKDKVLYPFGFGLSYTDFTISDYTVSEKDGVITVCAKVTNTGNFAGKEVVEIYYGAPQGKLGKPLRELIGYKKTDELQPSESQTVEIVFDVRDMASYDDGGLTGFKSCYVLEAGDYTIYAGNSVRSAEKVYTYSIEETVVVEKCSEALAPVQTFKRLRPQFNGDTICEAWEDTPLRTASIEDRIQTNRPKEIAYTGRKGYKLIDVYNGNIDMDGFIAQLDKYELATLVRGEGMMNDRVTPGTASCFGGVTDTLVDVYGIPSCCTADGPSGIRLDSGDYATLLPNGTLQACAWNPDLVCRIYEMQSMELALNKIDATLGPGMNIHRNPLCGRNFEYFSEDPLLSGETAAAVIRGVQQSDCSSTIKHFACNNQENDRNNVESIVSERALREIYLKGFEIAIKKSNPRAIMTSYNPVNGFWCASSYDLTETILRKEWGFDGMVMTDWWADMNSYSGAPSSKSEKAAMVRARNDVYMCSGNNTAEDHNSDNIISSLDNGYITIADLQRCAKDILNFILKTAAFKRMENIPEKIAEIPEEYMYTDEENIIEQDSENMGTIYVSLDTYEMCRINGKGGESYTYNINVNKSGNYRISLYFKCNSNSLAQLALFIKIGDNKYPVSLCGTDGKMQNHEACTKYIEAGEHEFTISFGPQNFADVEIRRISFWRND